MANDAAWQAGLDMGDSKKKQKAQPDNSAGTDKQSAASPKKFRGVLPMAADGLQALGRKMGGKGGAAPTSGAQKSPAGIGPGMYSQFMNALGPVKAYKNGGRVKKTGLALVHKGEYVIPAKGHRKATRKRTVIKA